MEDKINIAREKLKITFPLKEKQMETFQHVYEGKDCISVLPTGYGKSIIYQMMPWFLQKDLDRPGITLIVCPLYAIMQDQVSSLSKKGTRTTFINISGNNGHAFDCDDEDEYGESSPRKLYNAAKCGDLNLVQDCLREGADLLYKDGDDWTPLHRAAWKGNTDVIKVLLEAGASLSAVDNEGRTPLHRAAEKGNTDVTKVLLEAGASLSAVDKLGRTPLHLAAMSGNTGVTKVLLEAGASLSAVDWQDMTPLHLAAEWGNTDVTTVLLEAGASLSAVDYRGRTPLHRAAEWGNTDVTKVLLEAGASLSAVDKQGRTPLHLAAEEGKTDVIKVLLETGASLSAVNKQDMTPLHLAAWKGNTDVTKVLLEAGASLSAVDNGDMTPLHLAAMSGNTDMTKVLLEAGASLSAVNNEGWTPLHLAAREGNTDVIKVLLEAGASLSAVDIVDMTPLHLAAWMGNTDVTKVLLEAGASLSAVDYMDMTPLHLAARSGNTDMTKVLLEAGASLSAVDNEGWTPLHLAAVKGNTDVTKVLLEAGASLSAVDKQGKTPHDLAHGNVKKLLQNYMDKVYTMDMPSNTDEIVTQFPMMGTSDEIKELLSKGTFISYENCVYLGGACNVGKSTLASILIGEKIPQEWKSTDGLTIYFGRNGIDLKNKEMVPLKKGFDGDVLSKVLRGKPDITQEKPDTTQSKNRDVQPQDSNKGYIIPEANTVSQATEPNIAPTPSPFPEKDNVNLADNKQKSPQNYIMATIRGNIQEEIRKGTYKIEIAPSDLVDFGGQRSFDMTHQLFMRHKGTFVLMFNGKIDFSDPLDEYKQKETTEAILKHWVNSILSYCADDEDILPMIMFSATHSDEFNQEDRINRKAKLIHDLGEIFKNHKRQHRIIYDNIFFINGKDKNDSEINRLKSKLVEVALKQKSWGKRMPMAWVPLDLQMSQMRLHNNIISKEELTTLNQGNEDLALTVEQIKYFLNVQHSLGKILYFDQHGLDNFIIVQPQSLVNILRSFITDELFWPKDEELRGILRTLTKTGKIAKQDLLKLWLQEKFHQHMPNDDFKEFIIQVLVHLDILVEPKHYRQEQGSKVQSYLVPCIVKRRLPITDFYVKSADKMICLSYTLLKSSIPTALSFKLIGAALNVWPLKATPEGICLYHQAAILCIDESNELHLLVEDDKVFVYLINEKNKGLISPNIASAVQECLTLTMTKVLEFYHKSFGKSLSTSEVSKTFVIEVGDWCTPYISCYISVPEVKEKTEWICKNNKTHDKTYPRYWIFDKEQVECDKNCSGLDAKLLALQPDDKHLFRLAERIDVDACTSLFLKLGLLSTTWKDIQHMHGNDITVAKFFALCKWKDLKYKKYSNPSFQELSDALAKDYHTHFLCQLFMEDVAIYGIANSALQEIPEDNVLQDLSQKVGNCAIHLGVELGLKWANIEETLAKYPKSMYEQTFDVMKKWKISAEVKTIRMLMKAFQSVDGRGLNFFRDRYRV